MPLYRLIGPLWLGGAALLLLSALEVVGEVAGRVGFGLVILGVVLRRWNYNPELSYPQSNAGLPVEPSGVPVDDVTQLQLGATVLAYSQGRWWRAEVVAAEPPDRALLHFPGWDRRWDDRYPRHLLQADVSRSARPLRGFQVVDTPPGEAPEYVRRGWVGLVLPVGEGEHGPHALPVTRDFAIPTPLGMTLGRLAGTVRGATGYLTEASLAVEMLAAVAPEAAEWYRENAPRRVAPGMVLFFPADVCRPVA
jgi:hypothetical protein